MAMQRGASGMSGVSFILLIALLWTGAAAQSSDDCTNVIISMSPCLNYITGNSSLPTAGCCTQLGTVVKSKPECLCQVLNGGASNLGLNINQTQALALPAACKIQTPSTTSKVQNLTATVWGLCPKWTDPLCSPAFDPRLLSY